MKGNGILEFDYRLYKWVDNPVQPTNQPLYWFIMSCEAEMKRNMCCHTLRRNVV